MYRVESFMKSIVNSENKIHKIGWKVANCGLNNIAYFPALQIRPDEEKKWEVTLQIDIF